MYNIIVLKWNYIVMVFFFYLNVCNIWKYILVYVYVLNIYWYIGNMIGLLKYVNMIKGLF